MNTTLKKALIFGFFTAFLILGTLSMQRAMPEAKEDRIYMEIKAYSPFLVEKRIGGLTIIDKRYDTKEKPNASDLYHRLDELEKKWGKEYLRVEGNEVSIMSEKGELVGKFIIKNEKERAFLKTFFGI